MATTYDVRIWKTEVYRGCADNDLLRALVGGGRPWKRAV